MSMLAALDWAGAVGDIAADPLLDTESRLLSRVVVVQGDNAVPATGAGQFPLLRSLTNLHLQPRHSAAITIQHTWIKNLQFFLSTIFLTK